jgi:enoyl-CoA hydratase/carnithine racemase
LKLILNVDREGRLLRLELNRPEKRNALNRALCLELTAAIEEGDRDKGVGAILLSGAGSSFCAGMDLNEVERDLEVAHERLFTIGRRVTTPIVAAVQGAAVAGGTGLVANAHVVMASHGASFGLTEIRIGLWPFLIFRSVVEAVGERCAVELGITGRIFDAHEAVRIGLAHHITAAEDLQKRAAETATALAESSSEAIRRGLRFVAETRELNHVEAGAVAHRSRREQFATGDFAEGVRAFREKRRAQWPSHTAG